MKRFFQTLLFILLVSISCNIASSSKADALYEGSVKCDQEYYFVGDTIQLSWKFKILETYSICHFYIKFKALDGTITTVRSSGYTGSYSYIPTEEGIIMCVLTRSHYNSAGGYTTNRSYVVKSIYICDHIGIDADTDDFVFINADSEAILQYEITGSKRKSYSLKWTSTDESIVSVDKFGSIKARQQGICDITLTVTQSIARETVTATWCVIVILPRNIDLGSSTPNYNTLHIFDSVQLHSSEFDSSSVNFISSTPNVVYVSNDNEIVAVGAGSSTISIMFGDDISGEILFNVHPIVNYRLQEPTCSSTGTSSGRYCNQCKAWITPIQTLDRLAHTDNNSDSVCDICNQAFYNAQIPDRVELIESEAFDGCNSLISIAIPASVTHIEDDAFSNCGSVTLFVEEGSYAEIYCIQNSISYRINDKNS